MNLPIAAVNEFQEIYQRKLGVVLTAGEAGIKAENFLRLMMLLTGEPEVKSQIIDLNKSEK